MAWKSVTALQKPALTTVVPQAMAARVNQKLIMKKKPGYSFQQELAIRSLAAIRRANRERARARIRARLFGKY